jgi:hypothetical protein
MAVTIELFETGRTIHQGRLLRPDHIKDREAIARAKCNKMVERKRIALQNWGQYLASRGIQAAVSMTLRHVLPSGQSRADILNVLQKECAGSQQEQQLAEEVNVETSGRKLSSMVNIEPGKEPMTEEVAGSSKAEDGSGKGKTFERRRT